MHLPRRLAHALVPAIFAVGLLTARTSHCQDEDDDDYEPPFRTVLSETRLTLKSNGELRIRRHMVVKVLKPSAAETVGEVHVSYNGYRSRVKFIRGKTTTAGNRVIEVDEKAVRDMPQAEVNDYLMYTDAREFSFSMPAVAVGAVLDYEYEIRQKRPVIRKHASHSHWFGSWVPVDEERLVLSYPTKMKPTFEIRGIPDDCQETLKTGRTTILQWTLKGQKRIRFETGMPPWLDLQPCVRFTTLPDWSAVQEWYVKLADSAARADSDIRKQVEEIVRDTDDILGKIRALYLFMQKEIRYVGVELGQSAYKPHRAAECLKNRYGDCKDQAILLKTMLDIIGVEAHVALARIGNESEVNRDLPSPNQFNHAIVHVSGFDQPLWLDCTVKYLDERSHPAALDGTLALVVGLPGTDLVRIPSPDPGQTFSCDTFDIELRGDATCRVRDTSEFHGRTGMRARAHFENLSEEKRATDAEEYVRQRFGKNARLINYGASAPHDLSIPFSVSYEYEVDRFFEFRDDAFHCTLDPGDDAGSLRLPKRTRNARRKWRRRRHPYATTQTRSHRLRHRVTLPPEFEVIDKETAPFERTVDRGSIRFDYTRDENILDLSMTVVSRPCLIPANELETARRNTELALTQSLRSVILRDRIPQLRVVRKCEDALDMARKLVRDSPGRSDSWYRLALCCHNLRRLHEARNAYRKAIRLRPKLLLYYRQLAFTYAGWNGVNGPGGEYEKAREVMREAVGKVHNRVGALKLLAQYCETGDQGIRRKDREDYTEATATYRTLMEEEDEKPTALYEMGECMFARKKYPEAIKLFEQAMDSARSVEEGTGLWATGARWTATAMLGRVEETIEDIRDFYPDNKDCARELRRIGALLIGERKYVGGLRLYRKADKVHEPDRTLRDFLSMIALVAEKPVQEISAFKSTDTPEHTVKTSLAAISRADRKTLRSCMSRRMLSEQSLLDEDSMADLPPLHDKTSPVMLDLALAQFSWKRKPLAPGMVFLDVQPTAAVLQKLPELNAISIQAVLVKEKGEWRIGASGRMRPETAELARLADSYLREGDEARAKPVFELLESNLRRWRSSRGEAKAINELLETSFPDDATRVRILIAASLRGPQMVERAFELLKEAVRAMPESLPVLRYACTVASFSSHHAEAVQYARRLLQTDTPNRRLAHHHMLVSQLLQAGRFKECEEALDAMNTAFPANMLAKLERVSRLLALGRGKEALALLRKHEKEFEAAAVHTNKLLIYAQLGMRKEFDALAKRTLAAEDVTRAMVQTVGGCYRIMGRHRESAGLNGLLAAIADTPEPSLALAGNLVYLGNFDEARELYERISRIENGKPFDQHALGTLGMALREYDRARALFVRIAPDLTASHRVYCHLFAGCCDLMLGHGDKAKEQFALARQHQYGSTWPAAPLDFLQGRITLDQMIAIAQSQTVPERRKQFLAEAWYYAGVVAAARGSQTAATDCFRKSADARSFGTLECMISHAETIRRAKSPK